MKKKSILIILVVLFLNVFNLSSEEYDCVITTNRYKIEIPKGKWSQSNGTIYIQKGVIIKLIVTYVESKTWNPPVSIGEVPEGVFITTPTATAYSYVQIQDTMYKSRGTYFYTCNSNIIIIKSGFNEIPNDEPSYFYIIVDATAPYILSNEEKEELSYYQNLGFGGMESLWIPIFYLNISNTLRKREIDVTAEDTQSGIKRLEVQDSFRKVYAANNNGERIILDDLEDGIYKLVATDNVGNVREREITIDLTGPTIDAYYDENKTEHHSPEKWTNKDLYIKYEDGAGVSETGGELYNETGIHTLWAVDGLGNRSEATIKIDKTLPAFETSIEYKSEFAEEQNNYKSKFLLNIHDIRDADSGIAGVTVTPIVNDVPGDSVSIDIEDKQGQNRIEYVTYTYDKSEDLNRNIDNYIKFELMVTDIAGNHKTVTLGGDQGYFVPASIFTDYEEPEEEKNRVKVNFYTGITSKKSDCTTANYTNIRLKRRFSLTNSKDSSKYDPITEASFGNTKADKFNTSAKGIWERLTTQTDNLKDKIISDDSGTYCIDTAVENTGFTHKNISYDCIYEYTDPVNPAETITETICNDTIIKLTNNKSRYSIRVKGEEDTYLVINDQGEIIEGSTESFKMPDTAVVGLAIKVEDPDIEEYQVLVQGYVELTSENGKFKLQETDTNPVGVEGGTAGCGEFVLGNNNKNVFISRDKEMDGDWVKIGKYALQYNVTTVLAVELTEGYSGNQEQWTDKTVRLYAQSPSVLGGKARLIVGDAGSYNADGITARPNQPIKMEIVPAEGGQAFTELFWDFGNGKTSKENDYKKNNNASFENIYYEQSPERTGALSEYTLKIKAGTDEAEFKVNIIDTQFGTLYGDEVWRGEHIIKKEIIVPQNMKLQIGDTAHSEYDSDITCLCVGSINLEDKGGITVEQGGELILDEGEAKTIRFVQAGFKDDKYVEAAEEEKQNKWRGIVVKGNLSGDSLNLFDADCGLTVFPGVSMKLTDSIKMENCGNGILMNGESLKAKEIKLNKCSGYGLKLNSTLECEKLFVSNSGRGVVLTENGSLIADNLEIKDSITGIHLLGGNLEIGSGRISGCSEYGIKTDKDGNYNYESVIVEDNERNIYINGLIR
ncbi:hypothetical protein [Treponema bryantii]|uniref:hypothetical protein n=1 Tax=Treponema bryantii TaxID=163 RepID=UPI002B317F19|nr:hypothetical protein TRBR_28780 [Treponema bryantii]